MSLLKKRGCDFEYHVVGTGTIEAELKALADRLGLNGRIFWHGFQPDVRALLRGADVFLLPSMNEGLPNSTAIKYVRNEHVLPAGACKKETPLLKQAVTELKEYFAGRRRHFDLPLDEQGTDFQKRVWATQIGRASCRERV